MPFNAEKWAAQEKIEPEILREMTVPPVEVPPFKPHIRAEDIDDFDERDKKVLLTMSVLEQKQDFSIETLVALSYHLRRLEAELIRYRNSNRKIGWQWEILKWAALIITSSLLVAVTNKVISTLAGK